MYKAGSEKQEETFKKMLEYYIKNDRKYVVLSAFIREENAPLTRSRITQIFEKNMRKLAHPSRAKRAVYGFFEEVLDIDIDNREELRDSVIKYMTSQDYVLNSLAMGSEYPYEIINSVEVRDIIDQYIDECIEIENLMLESSDLKYSDIKEVTISSFQDIERYVSIIKEYLGDDGMFARRTIKKSRNNTETFTRDTLDRAQAISRDFMNSEIPKEDMISSLTNLKIVYDREKEILIKEERSAQRKFKKITKRYMGHLAFLSEKLSIYTEEEKIQEEARLREKEEMDKIRKEEEYKKTREFKIKEYLEQVKGWDEHILSTYDTDSERKEDMDKSFELLSNYCRTKVISGEDKINRGDRENWFTTIHDQVKSNAEMIYRMNITKGHLVRFLTNGEDKPNDFKKLKEAAISYLSSVGEISWLLRMGTDYPSEFYQPYLSRQIRDIIRQYMEGSNNDKEV